MSAESVIVALAEPLLSALIREVAAGADEGAATRRAAEQLAARVLHGPITERVQERIARIGGVVAEQRAATEARVSHADVDVLRRLATQHALTHEEQAAALRVATWAGARLAGAIPLPPVLATERLDEAARRIASADRVLAEVRAELAAERAEAPLPEGEP